MKFASRILVGLSALHSVNAEAIRSENFNENEGKNPCRTSVAIDCKLPESGESCTSTKTAGRLVPFLWFPKNECGETMVADITYQMCNDESNNGSIALNGGETYAKFKGQDIPNREFTGTFAPGCKEVTVSENLKKCKTHTMGMQMSGRIANRTGKNGCYSYVFNKARSKAIPETEVIAPQFFTQNCEDCGDTSVAISCTFKEKDGTERSCISAEKSFTFLNMPKEDCDGNPVEATITMRQCNNASTSIKPNANRSFQKFKGNTFAKVSALATIAPGQCTETVTTVLMDTCKSNFPMSINLQPQGKSCKCYLFKKAVIGNYDGQIENNPEIEIGNRDSNPLILWITEIADPRRNNNRRFIELYSPNKRNYVITEPITLIKFRGGKDSHSEVLEDLSGKMIDENGFLVICNDPDLTAACGYTPTDGNLFIDDIGRNDWAIADITYIVPTIIDIFGKPGEGAKDSQQDFKGGRAFRKRRVKKPNDVWDMDEWIVAPSTGETQYTDEVGASETSPGCWYGADMSCANDLVGPPTVSPAPSSEVANTSGKGAKKKGKGSVKSPKSTRRSRL